MTDSSFIDVAPGSRQPGSVQFIRQHFAKDPAAPFAIDLPGCVRRCGNAVAHSLKPIGRIVLAGDAPYASALVTAAVTDERGLDRAIQRVVDKVGTDRPLSFAVRLASRKSFADLVDRADAALGACAGCGSGGSAVVKGSIAVGLAADAEGALVWSDPVAARILVTCDDDGVYAPWKPGDDCLGVIFKCDTDWFGVIDRQTRCYDDGCAAGGGGFICNCGTTTAGTRKVLCAGWVSCSCS